LDNLTIKDSLNLIKFNMKITTKLILFLITTTLAFSQKQETIDSDRPGQTMSAHTVGKSKLQMLTLSHYVTKFKTTRNVIEQKIAELSRFSV
jgi:hypothetical protein